MDKGGDESGVDFSDVAGAAELKDECSSRFQGGEACRERVVACRSVPEDPVQCGVGDSIVSNIRKLSVTRYDGRLIETNTYTLSKYPLLALGSRSMYLQSKTLNCALELP